MNVQPDTESLKARIAELEVQLTLSRGRTGKTADCEGCAELEAQIATLLPHAAQAGHEPVVLCEQWAIYYDNLGEQTYESGFMEQGTLLFRTNSAAQQYCSGFTYRKHYSPKKVFVYTAPPAPAIVQAALEAAVTTCVIAAKNHGGINPREYLYCADAIRALNKQSILDGINK
jgi:hypothetical protein